MLLFPQSSPLLPLFVNFPFLKIPFPPSKVLLLLSSLLPILVISQDTRTEQEILLKIKQQWGNQQPMQSWDPTTSHCNWLGIECCCGEIVTGINLYGENIEGEIPPSICDLKNLTSLNLGNNNIAGNFPTFLYNCTKIQTLDLSLNYFVGKLPHDINKLSPNLQKLALSANKFTGDIPVELTALSSLTNLDLDYNQLSGLPSRIISWKSITSINLARNNLSGPIPTGLGSLPHLQYLDLSSNQLTTGQIPPELAQLQLDNLNLDLSSNRLSGQVPPAFENKGFSNSFLNNANMCSDKHISNLPTCSSVRGTYLALILVPAATIFLVILYVTFFRNNIGRQQEPSGHHEVWEMKPFHRVDFDETKIVSGLTDSNMIGSGGSGKVYRIFVNDSGDKVAVKKIWNGRKLKGALEKQFLTEIEILGTFRHANIVKLLCCVSCAPVKLLVYEYMEKQSLDKWLGRKKEANEPSAMHAETSTRTPDPNIILDWALRLKIAVGSAEALSYLHHDCSPPIIHRDVKSSNILLDSEYNAKLADFGLAKLTVTTGEPHTASAIAGSFGYIAPEYLRTRRLNEKIDIYSFGVVLLELATGKDPCKGNEHLNLADWSWQHYCEEHPIIDALDKDIMEPAILKQMENVFKLGLMCTSQMPSSRPTMKQVLELLVSFSHHENHGTTQIINGE